MISKAAVQETRVARPSAVQNGPQVVEQRRVPGYIHPTALVETERIGAGTRIWAFTHVSHNVVIGSNCNIGSHCYLESGVRIGDGVTIKNGNYIWAGVTISDGAFVGPQVVFTNDLHPRSPRLPQAADRYKTEEWLSPTMVDEGASIGGGAVIVAGVTLKRFCMVAAGAVVTRTVPAHRLVMGIPASIAGWVCCCGAKLNGSSTYCDGCLSEFTYENGELRVRE
jgi:acetyltransferase-like isoleucine patch superfamily enzyme